MLKEKGSGGMLPISVALEQRNAFKVKRRERGGGN